ncbi:MAG TPA: T9SS type A sorting domain-containing protein [Flavobacteriaceae bacterium]|nr:T9SS type A sorting domain-containing protein [Flavobacteriaceae bacterium]
MKTLLYFLIGFVLCFNSFNFVNAQEVENPPEVLTGQTWYLTKMIIDEEEMPFTPNEEVNQSLFDVEPFSNPPDYNVVSAGVLYCEWGSSAILFEGENEFYFRPFVYLMDDYWYCEMSENIDYHYIYFDEFWMNSDSYLGHDYVFPFHFYYTINQLEEHRELIVINDNGYEAHFQNVPYLSVEDHQISNLTLYPNPTDDFLYIENLTNPVQIEIYDLSGKVMLSQEVNEAIRQVDVSQLSAGMYFYGLSQNGKTVKTGKLMKN